MKNSMRRIVLSGMIALTLVAGACGSKPTTPTNPNAPKPATPKPPGAKPTPGKDSTKVAKPGEKPPEPQKQLPADKKVPVPADWNTVYDNDRGYKFDVPQGTQSDWQSAGDNIDVFLAKLPDPAKVAVMVVAYNDKNASKNDLVEVAKKMLTNMGEKDIKVENLQEISTDYTLADVTSTDAKGEKTKAKLLVATDVNDNYIMLVGSPEKEYPNNEKIIDAIWGSFGMYSGGYSGNS